MAFAENPTDFINDDTPGYVLAPLNGVDVGGIFDNGSANAFNMMQGSNPTFMCATADATSAVGKTLIVGGVSHTVREAKPDGSGFTLLELEQA